MVSTSAAGRHAGRRAAWPLLLLFILPWMSRAQTDTGIGDTISVDVNLVVLQVTVRNPKGGFVTDLKKDDFHIFEDGKPQSIELFKNQDVPVSVGLVVDNSTSMAPKRNDVIAAAKAFVQASNPADELFVVNFNEKPSLGLPPDVPFSNSIPELENALSAPPGGRTALYDAIEMGLSHLKDASRDKKVLIVISDGGDNSSHRTLNQVLTDAERSDVLIYTIGLFDQDDPDKNPRVLHKLARETGGEFFEPADSAEAVPVCRRIAAEIRHQYTLGYAPSNSNLDNTYRKIRAVVSGPHGEKLAVRAREGYIAAPHK